MKKNKGGRPTLYRPEYCVIALDFIGTGHSTESLGSQYGVDASTIYDWIKKYPEFAKAVKKGESRRADYIEGLLREQAAGISKGSTAAAIFLAQNWTKLQNPQRVEVGGKDGAPISVEIRDYTDTKDNRQPTSKTETSVTG